MKSEPLFDPFYIPVYDAHAAQKVTETAKKIMEDNALVSTAFALDLVDMVLKPLRSWLPR